MQRVSGEVERLKRERNLFRRELHEATIRERRLREDDSDAVTLREENARLSHLIVEAANSLDGLRESIASPKTDDEALPMPPAPWDLFGSVDRRY